MNYDLIKSFFSINPSSIIQDSLVAEMSAQEIARKSLLNRAWHAFYGKYPDMLKVKPNQPNDNIKLNFARYVVETGETFLFGHGLEFVCGDINSENSKYLSDVWKQSRKESLLKSIALNGGVCGHTFVKITTIENETLPRLRTVDPSLVTPIWNPEDYTDVWEYRINWNAIDPNTKKMTAYRQVIAKTGSSWEIRDEFSSNGREWQLIRPVVIWQYSFPPIFHCQNLTCPNEFWGLADIDECFLDALNARNFTHSNMKRIQRFHAHPKTFATGMTASTDLQIGVDDILFLPSPNAKIQNLEMQGDITQHLESLRYDDEKLFVMSHIPEIATGKFDSSGSISGVALMIHYQPIIQRTKSKQITYGEMLNDINEALLEIAGKGIETECSITWADNLPFPLDDAVAIDTLGLASKETLSHKLGFDYDKEKILIQAELDIKKTYQQKLFDMGNIA